MPAARLAAVVFPLGPGHGQDPRPRQPQEEVHLAYDRDAGGLGIGQRLAKPRVGGRERG